MGGVPFGLFRIFEVAEKPLIAKKDEGKQQVIKNGEIYYRYGGVRRRFSLPNLKVSSGKESIEITRVD